MSRLEEMYGTSTSSLPDGPSSYVSPLETFARLLSPGVSFEPAFGGTFVNSMTLFVPRNFWPEKPAGFGADLTQLLEPQLAHVGHSMAALSYGEWYYNFNWWGLLLSLLVVGWLLRRLDFFAAQAFARIKGGESSVMRPVISVIAISGLVDYVWVGAFTYMARAGIRAILFVLVASIILRARSRK